ncbi:MAG: hypothetical protein SFV15_17160 [Polyangiaceae bacterium]|nr:hypothetical protein [Polyangiaceae bacterium]
MDNLLFPVKLGPLFGLMLAVLHGCGYRSVYAEFPGKVRLSVAAPKSRVAYLGAVGGAVDGLRTALSQNAAYSWSDGYPRVELEVVRVDERPVGVLELKPGVPLGRGSEVSVTARAWVLSAKGEAPTRSTGDVRRTRAYGHAAGAAANNVEREKAIRRAAEATGQALAERILGLPVASDDLP